MNVTFLRLILGFSLISMIGCATIRGAPEPPRTRSQAEADPRYLIDPAQMSRYNSEADPVRRKAVRNEIIDERVQEINHQFGQFELDLWREGVGAGIGTDWVQLGIAAATTISGGEAAKATLGAVSSALVGAKASFDAHALFKKTLPSIMSQMAAERAKVRAEIEKNKQLSVDDYTIHAAMDDLQRLIRVGTIPGALQVIALDAGEKEGKARQEIKDIRTDQFVKDEAGKKILAFIMSPDGKSYNDINLDSLKKVMRKHGLSTAPGDIPMFLYGKSMADLRVIVANDLFKK